MFWETKISEKIDFSSGKNKIAGIPKKLGFSVVY